jgi:hypothetical protein
LIVKPSTVLPFDIVIVTSTATVAAPPVTNPCSSTSAANVMPGAPGSDAPRLVLHLVPQTSRRSSWWPSWLIDSKTSLFPAPYLALLAILGAMALCFGAWRATPGFISARVPLIFGGALLVAALIAGCHGSGLTPTTATPTGVTNLSMSSNALDSNGNPLNAARGMQFTLDVLKQ